MSEISESTGVRRPTPLTPPKISVIGVGDAGGRMISSIYDKMVRIREITIMAANTNLDCLITTKADKRFPLGVEIAEGNVTKDHLQLDNEATRKSLSSIREDASSSEVVFILTDLSEGTGPEAAWAVAGALKGVGALIVGVGTLNLSADNSIYRRARDELQKLRNECDTVIVIDGSMLAATARKLHIEQRLGMTGELAGELIAGITAAIATDSLINIDVNDLRTVMEKAGLSTMGVGEATGEDRIGKAFQIALDEQLLEIENASEASGALVYISGGEHMSLDEVTRAGEMIERLLPRGADVVWAAKVDPILHSKVRLLLVLTGIKSVQL